MGIKHIGERLTPTSKFSVQDGIAFENNVEIKEEKAKKVLARYAKAKSHNWIVTIAKNDGRVFYNCSVLSVRDTSFMPWRDSVHYIVRPWAYELAKLRRNPDTEPFEVGSYRGDSVRYTKEAAAAVRNIIINAGIAHVSIQKYNPQFEENNIINDISDSIQNRFDLMDFDE